MSRLEQLRMSILSIIVATTQISQFLQVILLTIQLRVAFYGLCDQLVHLLHGEEAGDAEHEGGDVREGGGRHLVLIEEFIERAQEAKFVILVHFQGIGGDTDAQGPHHRDNVLIVKLMEAGEDKLEEGRETKVLSHDFGTLLSVPSSG